MENAVELPVQSRTAGCFNSATAVKPWKRRDRLPFRPCSCSFNSATAVKPWKRGDRVADCRKSAVLQFGHGGEAVENVPARRYTRSIRCRFNSATAVKPWRTRWRSTVPPIFTSFNSATAVKPWRTAEYG